MSVQKTAFKNHLQRLKAGASQATALSETSRWISENTLSGGRPYSYKGREFQKKILDSSAREVVTRKCSQIGLTEMTVRKALALCGMLKDFTTIYTLPTATLAVIIAKTRVNPVIKDSPFLNSTIGGSDNVEVKEFNNGSFLYLRGAASSNAPISIPADFLVHDELDFSDGLVISQYHSRLTASEHKMKMKLSTPTLPGKGIDYEFIRSRRHFNFVKCDHCGHSFIPSYYDHVKIPGYTGDLMEITKKNIHKIDYQHAYVECPKCGKAPDMGVDHREWVIENPDENHVAEGFQVSPFDAPTIITPGYLVQSSTVYTNIAEFVNFNLGLPFFSKESVLAPDEVRGTIIQNRLEGSRFCVMGVDLGKTCHIVIANCSYDGSMQVVHREAVPLGNLKERYKALRVVFRVRTAVIDSLPYTDMVMALQSLDRNLWACVYTQSKGTALYTIHKKEDEDNVGEQVQRQLNVARDRTFDALMSYIRSGDMSVLTQGEELDEEFVSHCTDMRRVKDWNMKTQTIEFRWLKSEDGNDHFWFALSFAYLAKFIIGQTTGDGGGTLQMLNTFKLTKDEPVSNVMRHT